MAVYRIKKLRGSSPIKILSLLSILMLWISSFPTYASQTVPLQRSTASGNLGPNQMAFEERRLAWRTEGEDILARAYRGENVDTDVKEYIDVAGNRSQRQANPLVMRILLQFPDALSDGYRQELMEYYYARYFDQLWGNTHMWIGVSVNQMMNEVAPMYLFCELHPQEKIHYELDPGYVGDFPESFSYEGRTYSSGNYYNGLAFSRDLFLWIYDEVYLQRQTWAEGNSWTYETDNRTYTSAQLAATILLRDLAQDAKIAHRSDMMFQLIALNMLMDVGAKHWGGSVSDRDYVQYGVLENRNAYMAWSMTGDGNPGAEEWLDKLPLASPKGFSEIYLDVIGTVDEPDDYAHYQIEMNAGHDWDYVGDGVTYPYENNSQKWTYVTKYYTLGGSRVQWQLTLRTPQHWSIYDAKPYGPFRMWMNDFEDLVNAKHPHQVMGKRNIQYKNAMLILDREQLQIYDDLWNHRQSVPGIFTRDQVGIWDLYGLITGDDIGAERQVWVAIEKNNAALEVAVMGVDYPSLETFKQALQTNAKVGSNSFTTSKGDTISTDGYWDYGLINGQPIWGEYGHPIPHFPLMTAYDADGDKVIEWDWDSKQLKIHLNGETLVYDYRQWSITGEGDSHCSGDVNEDGTLDILDVQTLINLLEEGSSGDHCLDLNADQWVNEEDVRSLVERLLSGNW